MVIWPKQYLQCHSKTFFSQYHDGETLISQLSNSFVPCLNGLYKKNYSLWNCEPVEWSINYIDRLQIPYKIPSEFDSNILQNSICIDCSCTEFESDLQGKSVSWFMIHVSWFSFARSFYFLFNANDFFAWQCVRHARRVWWPLRMQRSGLLVPRVVRDKLERNYSLVHSRVLVWYPLRFCTILQA